MWGGGVSSPRFLREENPHIKNFEGGALTGGSSGYFFMFMCFFVRS